MDIKTLLDNLHEEVSCSVCMTTFTEPKMLPCLHTFCLHCLNVILRTSGRHDIITCPECRRDVQVPSSGNPKDLPTNFRINSLLDVLAIKECQTAGVTCANCDKSSRHRSYYFQCCVFCITIKKNSSSFARTVMSPFVICVLQPSMMVTLRLF